MIWVATFAERLAEYRKLREMTLEQLSKEVGVPAQTLNRYELGQRTPKVDVANNIAAALRVDPLWLQGYDVSPEPASNAPVVSENTIRFPIIGDVAAGYDHEAWEDWATGDALEVPESYLRGRTRSEFFALRVNGDSMFPSYKDGDKVLVLRQSTLNRPGDVGVIRYNSSEATLKRVDYAPGEDWMRLRPENPAFPPIMIEGADLDECQVLGIPWVLVREE